MTSVGEYKKKHFKKYRDSIVPLPNLIQHQIDSYNRFLDQTLVKVLTEFNVISDYAEKKFSLNYKGLKIEDTELDEFSARRQKTTLQNNIKATYELVNKNTGSKKDQEVFLFNMPVMTSHGTFIVNGVERMVYPQLVRSFGIFFTVNDIKKERLQGAKIIPARGSWIEIESEPGNLIFAKIDRKRKIAITSFLRIISGLDDKKILKLFSDDAVEYVKNTFKKDPALSLEESYGELYRRLRDGEMVAFDYAKEYVDSLFREERYDLSEIGRIRFNDRFKKKKITNYSGKDKVIGIDDLVTIIEYIVAANNKGTLKADDIDHLGSRRLRFFDEQVEARIRLGMIQMRRNIQDRMSIADGATSEPGFFINTRPIQAKVAEFFNTNPLSNFIDEDNILMELEDGRTVSALGPGGLVRERAGFEVRDVHPSHYGRLCPIHTPEGPNIGLILRLATYSRVNKYGVIETPYAIVKDKKITKKIKYLDAYQEEEAVIAHSGAKINNEGMIMGEKTEVRKNGEPVVVSAEDVEYIDVSSYQPFSVATSMIPFVNHNEANRALMGSNMQKQATPCIKPDAPLVATGIEADAAKYTGRLLYAKKAGEVVYVDGKKIEVKEGAKKRIYNLVNFEKINTFSVFHQRPVVKVGQKLKEGDLLADATSSDNGQIAVGQNMLVAFMSFYGANYEDAIIVSERVAKSHKFTNIHIKEYNIDVRETKLGPEQTTHDIPNVSEEKLKNLDEEGIIRIGAEVDKGDILIGKVSPKGETQLTPEERLLRSIFGEKAKDVKDTSLRLKAGEKGRVVGIKIFDRSKGEINETGVIKRIYIQVAELRNIKVGDKLSGRHGNKGVVSMILPEEDMPYTEDGESIDIILSPLGVPSRMNLGQILEVHMGLAANSLKYQAIIPPFAGADGEEIKKELKEAGYPESGKVKLADGKTGEFFERDITIGYMYVLKLHHMVEDKMYARSVGPYSLINQQPLGGKAQEGGQRFGEMEVWALLGHGAAYTLREVLTTKSDDILGRSAMYDSIIKGKSFILPNTPESFSVMLSTLRGLSLDISLGKNQE
ncbi:MAG: DNA-directed RNA polymerase subunit beta [Candidatus Pacebacteria bacterium]|nr:DNA-directed RNA polymerase subunit beta [Candidatus Paceibacterota bacterium]